MDHGRLKQLLPLPDKYKYGILVVIVGVILISLPSQQKDIPQTTSIVQSDTGNTPQEALAHILGQIQGVGRVEVLLTVAEGERIEYEMDQDSSYGANSGSTRNQVVLVTGENRLEQGLVRQIIPPKYLGAVIVCQGGSSPAVRLAVVEAVAAATGLTADKITVLKMK